MEVAISNRRLYPALAGGILLALLAGGSLKLLFNHQFQDQTGETVGSLPSSPDPEPVADSSQDLFKGEPFLAASPSLQLPNPDLLRSTSSQARVETVVAGRPDPFAPVILPTALPPKADVAVAAVAPPATVQPLPVVPIAATQALPALPILPPAALPSTSTSGIAVTAENSTPWQSPVDQLIISGVAQIGNQVSVIIKEPNGTSSRYVSSGDYVAGGKVLIKSVDLSNAEPLVVLVYQGKTYYKSVGSGSIGGML